MPPTLLFPPDWNGTFEGIPSKQRMHTRGESTSILLDTEDTPYARMIPFDKNLLDRTKIAQMDPEEYQAIFGTFHPRDEQGNPTFGQSSVTYLTAPADLPEGEADLQLRQRLRELGILRAAQPEWPNTQGLIEFLGPTLGATFGGAVGYARGGPVAAITDAMAGGAVGAIPGELTRSTLTPSRLLPEEQAQHGNTPGLLDAMSEGALTGLEGELGNQLLALSRLTARAIGVKGLVRDVDLTPEQQALFAKGGIFDTAAQLTGERAYPRPGAFVTGPLETIDKRVARALFSSSATDSHLRKVNRNLNAVITNEANQLRSLGNDAPFGERINHWLGTVDKNGIFHMGTLETNMRRVQRGLYQGADDILNAAPNAPTLNTTPLLNLFNAQGTGDGAHQAVAQQASAKISRNLAALDDQTFRTSSRLTESASQGRTSVLGGRTTTETLTPETATTVEATRGLERTRAPIADAELLNTGGIYPDTPQGGRRPVTQITRTAEEAEQLTTSTDLPLNGWLHTLSTEDATHNPEISVGRAMQIRSAVSEALRSEQQLARPDQETLAFLRRTYKTLDDLITPTLNNVTPGLAGLYKQADTFTAKMYFDLRNQDIMNDVIHTVGHNPEEFRTLATSPNLTQTLQVIKEAFTVSRHVPPGTNVPPALRQAEEFYDKVLMPEMRFQLLRSALPPAQHDTLTGIVRGNETIQQLIQQNKLLAPQPGAFMALRDRIGQDTYNAIMGGEAQGKVFLDVDKALFAVRQSDPKGQEVALAVLQWGGFSYGASGAGNLIRGQALHGLTGLAAGGTVIITPSIINKMITSQEFFERVILGIHTGPQDARVRRLFTDIAARAGQEAQMLPTGRLNEEQRQ